MRDENKDTLLIVTTAHSDLTNMQETIELRRAQQRFHSEREKLIEDLQQALTEVKTLQGILPICSFCKNIRNDQGYWEQVEAYVGRMMDARFSHSVCPTCIQKHYPAEWAQLEAARKKKG